MHAIYATRALVFLIIKSNFIDRMVLEYTAEVETTCNRHVRGAPRTTTESGSITGSGGIVAEGYVSSAASPTQPEHLG